MSRRLGPVLWKSKFILPQHREAIQNQKREGKSRKGKGGYDQQELELIERAISLPFREHRTIKITVHVHIPN